MIALKKEVRQPFHLFPDQYKNNVEDNGEVTSFSISIVFSILFIFIVF